GRKGSVKRAVRRNCDQYPQLERLAEDLLERGDPAACKLLIGIAPLVKRTAIYEALKKFAVGQRGSDELRIEALTTLSQAEYLTGEVPMWRQGELHPIRVLAQEVTGEPTL